MGRTKTITRTELKLKKYGEEDEKKPKEQKPKKDDNSPFKGKPRYLSDPPQPAPNK